MIPIPNRFIDLIISFSQLHSTPAGEPWVPWVQAPVQEPDAGAGGVCWG